MKKIHRFTIYGLCLLVPLMMTGCKETDVQTYADQKPALMVQDFFKGKVKSYGMGQDWCGKVLQRFTVDLTGEWKGDDGTITETYTYSDGKKDKHVWKFHLVDEHHFTATADDAIGELKGEQYGNAMHLQYRLKVRADNKTEEVNFDDWAYRIDERVVLNKIKMKKYGFTIGTFTISHMK